ncbi:glutathione S-transferase family protein [Paraburkholderia sp. J41]|uniref:glutathione S-transferase family protein n=1 Tax=Paraburkholderia sp. J41 TaxID=2805433 RepID=UPI002AC315D2|nr:glutathione S-transferase family protein [Paraburkholderia sp. J41]
MLVIHHLGLSQSDRIVWLCEELKIPYELKRYQRDPLTRLAPVEYRTLTPFGTSPVISDGELMLGESAAILEYLAHTYGEGRLFVPPGGQDYAAFLYWFHFANGSFMPAAMIDSMAKRVGLAGDVMVGLRARFNRAYDQVEARLGQVPFLSGDEFTAADIMTLFPLTTMRVFSPHDISPYPNILAYLERLAARPAFQRAMQMADPGFTVPLS